MERNRDLRGKIGKGKSCSIRCTFFSEGGEGVEDDLKDLCLGNRDLERILRCLSRKVWRNLLLLI